MFGVLPEQHCFSAVNVEAVLDHHRVVVVCFSRVSRAAHRVHRVRNGDVFEPHVAAAALEVTSSLADE